MPVIKDKKELSQHKVLHWQQGDYSGDSPWAVREGDWKLLGNPIDRSTDQIFAGDDTLFLVNLKEDVSEKITCPVSIRMKFKGYKRKKSVKN